MSYDVITYRELRSHDLLRTLQNCHECAETFNKSSRIWNLEESNIFLCDRCHDEKVNY